MLDGIETVFESLPVGVIFVDSDRKVRWMNNYALNNLFGRDYFGRDVSVFHNESSRRKIEKLFSDLGSGKQTELPFVKIVNFKGSKHTLLARLIEMSDVDSVFRGIVVLFYDISSVVFQELRTDDGVITVFKKIPVPTREGLVFVDVDRVAFVKSCGDSSFIYDVDGNRYFSNLQISALESKLCPLGFYRSHRSYIVNLSLVKRLVYEGNSTYVLLDTNSEQRVPVSRRNKSHLKSILTAV